MTTLPIWSLRPIIVLAPSNFHNPSFRIFINEQFKLAKINWSFHNLGGFKLIWTTKLISLVWKLKDKALNTIKLCPQTCFLSIKLPRPIKILDRFHSLNDLFFDLLVIFIIKLLSIKRVLRLICIFLFYHRVFLILNCSN